MFCFTSSNFNRYFYEYQTSVDGKIVITSIFDRQHHALVNPPLSLKEEIIAFLQSARG